MRRLTSQPILGLDLLGANLPRATVADLPRLAKDFDAHEPLTAIELADVLVGPRLPVADVVLVEVPGHLDWALALVGDHLSAPHDPRGGLWVDLGPLLQLVLVLLRVDVVAGDVLHRHHPVSEPGWLDVLTPPKRVVHASLHLRPQVLDEGGVVRRRNRQQERGLRIGTVEPVTGTDEPHAHIGCQFASSKRLDRVAAQSRQVVDDEPRDAEDATLLQQHLGDGVATAAGNCAAHGRVGAHVFPRDEHALPLGLREHVEQLLVERTMIRPFVAESGIADPECVPDLR